MALNIDYYQDLIFDKLKNELPATFRVVELAFEDKDVIERDKKGGIVPTVAVQIGDPQSIQGSRGMVSNRYDDYEIIIYIQSIAPSPRTARRMANKVTDVILGFNGTGMSQVRKRPAGNYLPIIAGNGATEAYAFPTSIAVTVQLMDA